MALMSYAVGRLGSRYSMILDPFKREVHFGALGLMCQQASELVVELEDRKGRAERLPFSKAGKLFDVVDQHQTMTSVAYEAHSLALGVAFTMEITSPFWPGDMETSLVPGYVVTFHIKRIDRIRWVGAEKVAERRGVLRFGLKVPGAKYKTSKDVLRIEYPVHAAVEARSGEGGGELNHSSIGRDTPVDGTGTDAIVPLVGSWRVRNSMLEIPFDVREMGKEQTFRVAMVGYCGDGLFERFGQAMKLKYTLLWQRVEDVIGYVRKHYEELVRKSRAFDALWLESPIPKAGQNLSAMSFQSYLMNTMWCAGSDKSDWFSVWEGSCWYNSTVDVTYNEAMFYFACWPELLELIFDEWMSHVNLGDYEGAILEHDMGFGWSANGQSYHHSMPVEENANFLLLLYAHGVWWGREKIFVKYINAICDLTQYLLWSDSTGNGFPDRGTSNTIDDASPAVQYGRDNVYLGIKRLAALHAAGRMLTKLGENSLARECEKAVKKAIKTLNDGWLGDHWGVCLDKTTKGLTDCWSGKPLGYKILPGWDAYSLYTTNGLLYLMMIDDLPKGLDMGRIRSDLLTAMKKSMTLYGCGHSSSDRENVWISMNVWRDCAGGYLGENLLANCDRYWDLQVFANSSGAEKPNCFTETTLKNNLVWYPRGAATFGLMLSGCRLMINHEREEIAYGPICSGRWPLLPLADWKKGKIPMADSE